MALTRPKYSQIYDTDWKQSVEIASTADVGNLILGNTQPNSIDGVTVLTNWRVLVKDQTNGAQNGIYVVRNAGTGSNGWWTRSLDAAQSNFVTAGLTVAVISGSINGGKEFRLTTPDPITLGTTALTFIDPNAAAGAGGANTQVQFNDLSTLAGSPGFTFNKGSNVLTLSGNVVTTSGYFVGNGAFLTGIVTGGTVNYTTSNSAPTSPNTGDFWYNSSIDVLFQYTNDGVGNIWVDIAGPSIQASGVVFDSGVSFIGNINVTGNVIPSANLTYDLGSPSLRWRTGYFGANTIDLGGNQISVDPVTGFTFTVAGASPVASATKPYVDGQITAANAGVTTANLGMRGYVDAIIPSSTGNVGKYLTTNGSVTSWSTLPTVLPVLNRSGASISVSVGNGLLSILTRAGTTANVAVN